VRRFLAFTIPLGVAFGLVGACTTNALVGAGGACFQSVDCQEGLVCIPTPGADGGGTCSNDLTSVNKPVEAGGDAPATTDAATDATTDTSVPDTGIPDNNVPETTPPADTGTQDTGASDAGSSDAPPG